MHSVAEVFEQKMSVSFEFFPPKEGKPLEPLMETAKELTKFKPDFYSVTYGAGGTNKGRNLEICSEIEKMGVPAVSHMTCIGNTREYIKELLAELKSNGVHNILALRGDLPAGWTGTQGDFSYAVELIDFIKKTDPSFCVAGAISPEMHVKAKSVEHDIMYNRRKKDAGAEFFMTQLFYDNEAFYDYRDRLYAAGADLPIDIGVMPVLNKDSVLKMTIPNGSAIPSDLARLMANYGDNPEDFRKAGIEYTVNQIVDLINNGADGIHLFSLNKVEAVSEIIELAGMCRYGL